MQRIGVPHARPGVVASIAQMQTRAGVAPNAVLNTPRSAKRFADFEGVDSVLRMRGARERQYCEE
jgi:hypothetical protein